MEYHSDLVSQPTEESPNLQCVRRAYGFFHGNFLYFGLALLVPVLFAYGIHEAADALARSAMRGVHYDRGPLPYAKLAAVVATRWTGYSLAAVIFGFVSGGITVAVRELRCGNERTAFERALEQSRARIFSIAGSVLLQYFGLLISFGVSFALVINAMQKLGIHATAFLWISWIAMALCLGVFSRWMLSVSVIIEEGCGVFASFRRSQELTASYTPAMLLFVAHAAIAGYIAGMIPYYAFDLLARRIALPAWSGWLPFVLSFVFVAWTEPICAIGCAETYYSACDNDVRQPNQNAQLGESYPNEWKAE